MHLKLITFSYVPCKRRDLFSFGRRYKRAEVARQIRQGEFYRIKKSLACFFCRSVLAVLYTKNTKLKIVV